VTSQLFEEISLRNMLALGD